MQRYLLFTLAVLFLVFSKSAGCSTGSVRLDDGILQICNNSEWRSVCSEDWGNLDAAVACKHLGFDGGYTVSTRYISNQSQLNPVSYHCNGTENNLQNCDRESQSWCYRGVNITCVRRNSSDSCRIGDIRLWGGSNQYEGNIELCTDQGIWSTISDSSWGNADAVVACRHLGYANSIAVPIIGSRFGRRLQAMEYGGMSCRGNESSLMQCGYNNRGFVEIWSKLFFSNQGDYAGVRCIPGNTRSRCSVGDVRLANGFSNNNGFAEVCIEGQWIRICRSSFSHPPAVTSRLCSQLGYQRSAYIDQTFFTLNRSQPLAYVYEVHYRSSSQKISVLNLISNSTSYGYQYADRCADIGILCCPNDTTRCSFTEAQTCPPENPTTRPTSTPSTVIPTEGNFALHFGSAASSLILANSADLRGLKKDIKKKIQGCLDEERDCSKSTLNEGFLSIGENIRYEFQSNMDAAHCVDTLKDCLEKNPRMQYHSSDLYLDIEFEYTE